MCEAKMHYADVVALWYIFIIKSVCGLLTVCLLTLSSTDSACTQPLGMPV